MIDGEFFLPVTLAHLDVPVVYLANPHDLDWTPERLPPGEPAAAGLLRRGDHLQPGLHRARPAPELVPGTACLEVPALCQDIPLCYRRPPGRPGR